MSDACLVVDHAAAQYGRAILALHDVSLRVDRGEIVALVGANGAGKTTLLRAIANLLPAQRGRISRGRITFGGRDVTRETPGALVRAGLASVLEGRHCFGSLSVEENLVTGGLARGLRRQALRRDLDHIYELFPGLAGKRTLLASQVSGGEQQMVAIGRALMSRPTLLLLDEPSMGLAPLVAESIFATLTRLNRESGLTVLVAEQNVMLAQRHAHRLLGLAAGAMKAEQRVTREQLDGLFFGHRPSAGRGGAPASEDTAAAPDAG